MKLLLLAVVLIAFTACSVDKGEVVARVIDGDTFVTNSGEIIRIYNIDAPEMTTPEGVSAREALIEIMGPPNARWKPSVDVHRRGEDQYGRTLACIGLPFGGTDIGELMLISGHARAWEGATC